MAAAGPAGGSGGGDETDLRVESAWQPHVKTGAAAEGAAERCAAAFRRWDDADSTDGKPLSEDDSLLDLSARQLTSLPRHLGELAELQVLDVSQNPELDELPGALERLALLRKVVLTGTALAEVPANVLAGWCNALQSLRCGNLVGAPMRTLPPEIGLCTSLRVLDVPSCGLVELPGELGELKASLMVLRASHNQLTTLPPPLGRCTRLCTLEVTGNPWTDRELEKALEQNVAFTLLRSRDDEGGRRVKSAAAGAGRG